MTAARTMEVLRRCPLAIAQRLVHRAIAVSTAELGSHKDNVRCTAVEDQPEVGFVCTLIVERQPIVNAQPTVTIVSGPQWPKTTAAHDLFGANLRVQLHLPPLGLAWNPVLG